MPYQICKGCILNLIREEKKKKGKLVCILVEFNRKFLSKHLKEKIEIDIWPPDCD